MEFDVFAESVIYEDNHLLVVNKPNNILVQGDITRDETLLDIAKRYIKIKYKKPGKVFLGLVHRLDRPVSGVLIFARTSKALTRLNQQLRAKEIKKTYVAISRHSTNKKKGEIVNYLVKDQTKNKVRLTHAEYKDSKKSETQYEYVGEKEKLHLFKLSPKTGRSHQLRVHMKSLNCSILGDLKYGDSQALSDKSIALHCFRMQFIHPTTKEEISATAHPPNSTHWKKFNKLINNI
jgi:23S rRNA pseudouridine1911/1915/1917 synthase